MKKCLLIVGLMMIACNLQGLDVRVSLFTGTKISRIVIQQSSGNYALMNGGIEIAGLSQGDEIILEVADDQIQVLRKGEMIAFGEEFSLMGTGFSNSFSAKVGGMPVRYYDDNLFLSVSNRSLQLINQLDLEKYIGGVIQAEAGGSTQLVEFFMVQAMVSRTYAMKLILNNAPGFVLSDDVSNQVYKGRPVKQAIFEAVERTRGEVIVYNDTNLISAVFHSNSGGNTMAAGDVWVSSLPYLQPVMDTFSVGCRNSAWTLTMPVVEWLNYLNTSFNYPVHIDSMKLMALDYSQDSRAKYFHNDIPLTRIRQDLKLKSTWFSITTERDKVVFSGRGYGHGVGLSQEGAIRMAEFGYCPDEIIRHYYPGTSIIAGSYLMETASLK